MTYLIPTKEGEYIDISNLNRTEKSNFENKLSSRKYLKIKEEISLDLKNIVDNFYENLKITILKEIKKEEKQTENILIHKLMKKMDSALLSSDEFSIKGDNLRVSQNCLIKSQNDHNLGEIKELEKSHVLEINLTYKNEEINISSDEENCHYKNREKSENVHKENLYKNNVQNSAIFHDGIKKIEKSNLEENKILYDKNYQKSFKNDEYSNTGKNNCDKLNKVENSVNLLDNELNKGKIEGLEKSHDIVKVENQYQETIQICDYNIDQLKILYSKYIEGIDSEQKIIYNINESIESYFIGCFPKFIEIIDNSTKKIISFSCLYYDGNFSTGIRLVLSSFSTDNTEKYFEHAEKTIDFLNENFPNTEIYIELFYGVSNEKFYVNDKLRDVFSKKLKFKWITLENTGTQRIVKYRLSNIGFSLEDLLSNKIYNNHKLSNYSKELCENINSIIDIKINTIITFKELFLIEKAIDKDQLIHYINSPREFTKEETDVNIFPAIYLLSDLINKSGFKVNNDDLKLFSNERTRVNIQLF